MRQAGVCSQAGCTDRIHCDVDKADKVCDLVDPA